MSFLETADEYNIKKLTEEIEALGFTLEQIQESSAARVVVTMRNIQKLLATRYKYNENRVKRPRKLFDL